MYLYLLHDVMLCKTQSQHLCSTLIIRNENSMFQGQKTLLRVLDHILEEKLVNVGGFK